MQRPQSVTILAVLAAIGGALGVIGGITGFFGSLVGGAVLGALGAPGAALSTGITGVFWSLILIAQGAVSLLFAYGAWFLKPWAWMIGMVAAGVGLLVALINLIGGRGDFFSFLISAAISGVIIYYLFTPAIKKVFGRA